LCNFPCFWGISPGKSWKAALEQLQGFILYINATPQTNNSTLHTISSNVGLGKKGITYNITVSEDKDLIEYVAAQLISENFADKLDAFTPQEILSRYGSPEKVQLYVGNDTENPEYQFYHLWFVYDKKNFYVLYTGYARNVQNSYEICPLVQHFDLEGHSDNYGIVEFASILRSSADSLEKFIKERDQLFGNSQSIEVASGLSSTDFTVQHVLIRHQNYGLIHQNKINI
jgi:hypothetical protein